MSNNDTAGRTRLGRTRRTLWGFALDRITFARSPKPVAGGMCWLWTSGKDSRGYGRAWFDGKMRQAHIVTWHLYHGRWPDDGLVLDHRCSVKPCVNPRHLEEVTQSVNVMRATPRGDAETERRRAQWRESKARRRERLAGVACTGVAQVTP